MRKRTMVVGLLVVALVMGTSALAIAGNGIFVSKPDVMARRVDVGKAFKVKGYVWPSSVSSDTVSSVVIRVLKLEKSPGVKPQWSQVATIPASFGRLQRRRAVAYCASVTITSAGSYRLRAALIQTDTVVAQSAHRPLTVPKPKARGRHK
jgi:hypothetical protein